MAAAVLTPAVLTPPAAPESSAFSRALGSAVRVVAASGLAGVITVCLFGLMQALIASDAPPPTDGAEPPVVTISFDVPDREPPPRGPRDPRLDAPIAPPPSAPRITAAAQARPAEGGFAATVPAIETDAVMQGLDRIALAPPPLATRVEPVYPRRELALGVQGDCTIRYDILASGRTANLSVLRCDTRGFERASLEAVAGWRHAAARGQDQGAVVRRGVTTTLSFRLQD